MTKIISVYFNGTDESNDVPKEKEGFISLAALLDHMTVKDDLKHHSICVNGCGIETEDIRDIGGIFTFHLEKQVLKIAKHVEETIANSDDKIILNVYGFSRGGAAAFLLCQKLKHISADHLTINIAALEPVPGNFITGVYGDLLLGTNSSLSAAVADLTDCNNIANIFVLFTNEPMPDIFCHAPILPALPINCKVEVDVTPGCHKSAATFYKMNESIKPMNNESAMVFHRIVDFMHKCGTSFNFNLLKLHDNLICPDESKQDVINKRILDLYLPLAMLAFLKNHGQGQSRSMHLSNTIFTIKKDKRYLNCHHKKLSNVDDASDKDCLLTIQNRNPQPMSRQHHRAIQFMQLAFVLAMAGIIYKYFNEPSLEVKNQMRPRF